jgi:hypothetical protein
MVSARLTPLNPYSQLPVEEDWLTNSNGSNDGGDCTSWYLDLEAIYQE